LVKHGRFSKSTAVSIQSVGWEGIYAVADCGITDKETGFHAAGGDYLTAIISNGPRSVVIETNGILDTQLVLNTLVMNFEFLW
jgi:hypothetical protein